MFDSFTLAASTSDLGVEPTARDHADLLEFRLDLASDPLPALDAYDGSLPVLVTNRPTWEGGEATPGPDRLDALEAATTHDAVVAVDLELAALRRNPRAVDVADAARDRGVSVVASVHDFESTPSTGALTTLLDASAAAGDLGKVAVTAHDRADTLRLLSATHAATLAGDRIATMAMGAAGRHTRAVAPLYGSRIGYAPVDADGATAPGQYDLETLSTLVARLGDDSVTGNPES